MAGITHIDSAAIGTIVKSLTKLKAGGGLRIASAQPMIVYVENDEAGYADRDVSYRR